MPLYRGPDVLVIGWIPFFFNNPPAPGYPPGFSTTELFKSGNPDPPIAFRGYSGFRNWNFPGLLVGTKEYRATVYMRGIHARFDDDGSPPDIAWQDKKAHPGFTPFRSFSGPRIFSPVTRRLPPYSQGHGPVYSPRVTPDPAGQWVEVSYKAEFKLSWLPNLIARLATGSWAPYAWVEIFYRFQQNGHIDIRVIGSAIPSLALYTDWRIPEPDPDANVVPTYDMLTAQQGQVAGFLQTIGWGCQPAPQRPGELTWSGTAEIV